MAVNIVVRGKWKHVELEPNMFLQKDMNHLISIEELTDYNITDSKNTEVLCKMRNPVLSLIPSPVYMARYLLH